MSVARVWALPGLGGMGGLRAEFAAGTQTPHPSHRKKQALPAVHPNSKPCVAGLTLAGEAAMHYTCVEVYPGRLLHEAAVVPGESLSDSGLSHKDDCGTSRLAQRVQPP